MKTFITFRAESHARLSANYADLDKICNALHLRPLSLELVDAARWHDIRGRFPDQRYLPSVSMHQEAIALLDTKGQTVAALVVTASGFYGATLAGGGNDLDATELRALLKRTPQPA